MREHPFFVRITVRMHANPDTTTLDTRKNDPKSNDTLSVEHARAQPLADLQPTHILVHYNEIGLKGRNRGTFENRLAKNLKTALRKVGPAEVRRLYGRIAVLPRAGTPWREAQEALSRVFGVAYVMPAVACEPGIEPLEDAVGRILSSAEDRPSFAIRCKRSAKSLPYTSMDVQRAVGAHVQKLTGWPVDLDNPELEIKIELVDKVSFIAFGKSAGPGGLPTGVSGRVVVLLSGGIDSPVAAYRLLQRGSVPVYAHFHSYPHTGRESQDKVRDLIARIHPAGIRSRLYMVPFADLQRKIVTECPAPLRVVLYRRFMVRAAERVALSERALALVSGESLGQVASQTLENIRTIDAATSLPILRPLIGMDKIEIVGQARRIGTYDTSIEPHDDCCSHLMPANPVTHSTPRQLEDAEKVLSVEREVEKLVEASTIEEVGT